MIMLHFIILFLALANSIEYKTSAIKMTFYAGTLFRSCNICLKLNVADNNSLHTFHIHQIGTNVSMLKIITYSMCQAFFLHICIISIQDTNKKDKLYANYDKLLLLDISKLIQYYKSITKKTVCFFQQNMWFFLFEKRKEEKNSKLIVFRVLNFTTTQTKMLF